MEWTPIYRVALSIALGFLVGFQREWAEKRLAGIRTFPLVAVFGTLTAQLSVDLGGWVFAGALLALALLLRASERSDAQGGVTTEVAVVVMFAVGALVALGPISQAVAVAGAVAVLLQWKRPLHDFVGHVAEADVRWVMQLVLIALVILPVLPNRALGPYGVLNPFEIWSMVVLIVGISLLAYVVQRVLGNRAGTVLAGVLGGLVSSTATAVSYARRSGAGPEQVPAATLVIALSSASVLPRVLFVGAVVSPLILAEIALPLLAMLAALALISWVTYLRTRDALTRSDAGHEPSDLRAAIGFGLLYAAVLMATAAANRWLGEAGLYSIAALSGLTDVDAISLSTLRLVRAGAVDPSLGWRLILVGILANLLFKGAVVWLWGHAQLRRRIAAIFGSALGVGLALLRFWPG